MFAVESRQFAHESVEPAIGAGQLPQREEQKARRAARPQQQRKMGEIAALNESLRDLAHGLSCVFLRVAALRAFGGARRINVAQAGFIPPRDRPKSRLTL
jgi:hypothetical protein